MATTPEQKLLEITDIVRKEIEEINTWLAKPAGLTDEQRKHLIHSLRMLHWFMELLTTKDQTIVPLKEDEKKKDADLKKLLERMTPPKPQPNPPQYPDWFPPTAPGNPFAPKRKKKDEHDPVDDLWRNDPFDWRYHPFRRRRDYKGGFRLMCSADPHIQQPRPSIESMRNNLYLQGRWVAESFRND